MIPNRKALVSIGLLVMAGAVQAATFINTCPFFITSPGDYLLSADLICSGGTGILITSSDVTLKLEGHRITAGVPNTVATAIVALGTSTTVRLERVRILGPGLIISSGVNAFVGGGVGFNFVNHSEVSGVTVLGARCCGILADSSDFLTIRANTLWGIAGDGIILVNVHKSRVVGNVAGGNNSHGMVAQNSPPGSEPVGTVSYNVFTGNGVGLFVGPGSGATIQHNVSNGNAGGGIGLGGSGPSEVTNNTSVANGAPDLFDATSNCTGHVWSGNTFLTANQSCIH